MSNNGYKCVLPQRRVCKTPLCYTHILFFCILLCRNGSAFIDLVFRSKQWLHPAPTVIIDYANMNNSRNWTCNYGIFMIAEFQRDRTAHPDLSVIAFRIIQNMVLCIQVCFSCREYAGVFHIIADNIKAIDICLSRIMETLYCILTGNLFHVLFVSILSVVVNLNPDIFYYCKQKYYYAKSVDNYFNAIIYVWCYMV